MGKKLLGALTALLVSSTILVGGAAPAQAAGYTGNCYTKTTHDWNSWRYTVSKQRYCEYVTSLGVKMWIAR